jgi:MFS family permease
VIFVTLGSLSYGYCASVLASTLGQPQFLRYFGLVVGENKNADALIGATNGLLQTGGLFGALLIGCTADKFSRRGCISLAAAILCIGGALQAASQSIAMFLAMRFLTGIGVGSVVGATPLYANICSPNLFVSIHTSQVSKRSVASRLARSSSGLTRCDQPLQDRWIVTDL